jgi:hypothetical protein
MEASKVDEMFALHEALDDEANAWETCDQVVFGLRPLALFRCVQKSKTWHISALRAVFGHYGVRMPGNAWPGCVQCFSSIKLRSLCRSHRGLGREHCAL